MTATRTTALSASNCRPATIVPLTPDGAKSFVQEIDAKFPEEALFRHNQRDKRYLDLFRINLVTGASELVYENKEYAWLVTDSDFKLRLATKYAADGSAEIFERRADGSFAPFMSVPIGDLDMLQIVDFSADGNTMYMIDARGRDKAAVFAVDMATQRQTARRGRRGRCLAARARRTAPPDRRALGQGSRPLASDRGGNAGGTLPISPAGPVTSRWSARIPPTV